MFDFSEIIKYVPASCRVMITIENGHFITYRVLADDEHIASINAFVEIAKLAGYTVQHPRNKSV
ncbi:hypothetical protein FCN80_10240 [Martelella alba]|uniref:KTSC domain-containing protein n=1 Tax=Martelella alba TaxID=2590451 RepID=A0ABY2SML9_9HYPH|nr:hypothetical protein FCN80_10240 [Martelella alba]